METNAQPALESNGTAALEESASAGTRGLPS